MIEYSSTLMDISESPPKKYKYEDLKKGDIFQVVFDSGDLDEVFRMRVTGGGALSLSYPTGTNYSQLGDMLTTRELKRYRVYKVNIIVEAYYQTETSPSNKND